MILSDRIALISGSGSGIGKGIALRFAAEGAVVVINDIMEEKVQDTVKEIKSYGGRCLGVVADTSETDQVVRLFEKITSEFGRMDILVNNVGIGKDRRIVNMTDEDWDSVIKTNLRSYFLCSREAAKVMISKQYGRIINISSRAWLGGFGQANYSASKGGIVSLTRTLALELGKKGITVNCIAPGIIDTPLFRTLKQEDQDRLAKTQAVGKIGSPEDIAHAALFFASDKSWYITGQTLYVCGGRSISSYVG